MSSDLSYRGLQAPCESFTPSLRSLKLAAHQREKCSSHLTWLTISGAQRE